MKQIKETTQQTNGTLLTAVDVAERLAVSQSTVRMWVSRNEIPYIRLGRLVRFRQEEVEAWLQARESCGRWAIKENSNV